MVSVCLPSDSLLQHLLSYLGFSYLGRGVSLHGYSSKAQKLFLTLDEGNLLKATPPDLERGVAPLSPPVPEQLLLLGCGAAPLSCRSLPQTWGSSSLPRLLHHSLALSPATLDLGHASVQSVTAGALLCGPSHSIQSLEFSRPEYSSV